MKIIKKILMSLAILVVSIVLFICAVVLVDSVKHPDEIPSFFGWKPFIIVENQVDELKEGDIAFVKEIDIGMLKSNDVIAYKDKDNLVTLCKISSINNDQVVVKVNTLEEEIIITTDQIEGKYLHKASHLGTIALEIQQPMIAGILLAIPIIVMLALTLFDNKKEKTILEDNAKKQESMEEEIRRLKKQNAELKKKQKDNKKELK